MSRIKGLRAAVFEAMHKAMVDELKANEDCKFTDEQLEAKDIAELEILLQMSGSEKTAQDFSAGAPAESPVANVDNDAAIPPMPELFPVNKGGGQDNKGEE